MSEQELISGCCKHKIPFGAGCPYCKNERIEEQRDEIGKLKAKQNKLEQANQKLKK